MSVISFSADNSTLTLNGDVYRDFIEGDIISLTYKNPHTSRTNSTRKGVTIQGRSDSGVADLIMRVQAFSDEDVRLNKALNGLTVFNGSLKEVFQRDGIDSASSYSLENGSITTKPSRVKNTQDGNELMEYTIEFRDATRTL